jgi:hypothetical protein
MSEQEPQVTQNSDASDDKDMTWLIGYMRDLIAKEIESEVEEILEKEPNLKKMSLRVRSKIEGLQRAAEIARERS